MKRRSRRTRDGVDDYSEYYDEEVQLDDRRTQRERDPGTKLQLPPWLVHLMILACVGLLLLGLLWATAGGPVLEKTLQALAAPLGLVWLGLFTVTYFCLLNKLGFPAFVSFACWIVLTVSGNAIFSGLMVSSLQGEFEAFNFGELKHLDVAVILGGGMMTTPSGDAQVTDAGDRAIMALRLLREGKADRIICTGTSGLPLADGELTQADSLEQLLLSLGVTQDKIVKIGGRNTIQEMQALDKWLSQNNGAKMRVGIVTSAWHLPRAIRLANSVGIKAEPVPADFSNSQFKPGPSLLIPASDHVHQVTQCLKEHMARLFGR